MITLEECLIFLTTALVMILSTTALPQALNRQLHAELKYEQQLASEWYGY